MNTLALIRAKILKAKRLEEAIGDPFRTADYQALVRIRKTGARRCLLVDSPLSGPIPIAPYGGIGICGSTTRVVSTKLQGAAMDCLTPPRRPARQNRPDCMGSTCMKWTSNGELSDVDLTLIMERLAVVDANLSVMDTCSLEEQTRCNPSGTS